MTHSRVLQTTNSQATTQGEEVPRQERVLLVLGYNINSKQFYIFDPCCCAWGPCAHQGYIAIASRIEKIQRNIPLPEGFLIKPEYTNFFLAIGVIEKGSGGEETFALLTLRNLPGGENQAWEERAWLSEFYSGGEAGPLGLARIFE